MTLGRVPPRKDEERKPAVITLKLVGERGNPLANTKWSIITPGGDVVKEANDMCPLVALSEGDYRAVARNNGRTYERNFKIESGVNIEIEVFAK
jgi:hypothetical protein